MEAFNRSLDFDKRFFRDDIAGSLAYARALKKCGVLTSREAAKITAGLQSILKDEGRVRFLKSDEDIHMAVERLLTERIGAAGKKIHTGRSRNDQVALDTRLYVKREIAGIRRLLAQSMEKVLGLAEKNRGVVMPAFTHLQYAQPVLMGHYFLSWFFMLERDAARLTDCLERLDVMPLGSGALAGSGFNLDRTLVARALGFSRISDNSMDAVSDRDHLLEFLSAAAILGSHLSRFAEDLVIFSSPGYGFFELSDAYSTGSSMMPNKKNPDSLELIRGKSGRLFGNFARLFTVVKGLPLTYNKDLQEDKEPLFDTVDTLSGCLRIFTGVLATLTVHRDAIAQSLTDDMLATDLADALTRNGLPFRDAHKVVGNIVRDCREKGVSLRSLTRRQLTAYSSRFPDTLSLTFEASVCARSLPGGTGPASVAIQLKKARRIVMALKKG
ncbi:MAG: argininosuccinate lyase [Fibrobacterota bacterium]